ncbi:MAG: low molecular weight phosphotyrosine protein phosphatase, partial [Bacteroidales bacterium]|nr:low molecular weight phosphotyrosine protein phosphatase [Bacteroidales bacterium]
NICRSPTAHGVFEQLVRDAGLADRIGVDSAGTGDWHVGHAPDPRSSQAALGKGVDISALRARQVSRADFSRFDYVLAMDRANLAALEQMKPRDYEGHLGLFLPFAAEADPDSDEVPDPYHGGLDGFDDVYQLVHRASVGLLRHIRDRLGERS